MDRKLILKLQGNVLLAFEFTFALPIIYAAAFMRNSNVAVFFCVILICVWTTERLFKHLGRKSKRRLPLLESAISMLLAYPIVAAFAALPFWYSGWLNPVDAMLETISDLTSAGLSLLPESAPYVLKLWQSVLMWFGSLIFLVMLVTVLPEVSGCFGMSLSLHGGQNFSPILGQMLVIAQRVINIYSALTLLSFLLFKLAGLGGWDSLLMAMRCISTGGGNYFPARGNLFAEYAAAFTMLLACGNLLFYHRLIVTIPPPVSNQQENFYRRGIIYLKQLGRNIFSGVKKFFSNSEVKTVSLIILLSVLFISFSTYRRGIITDGNLAFRYAFFHVVSFMSTTGINLETLNQATDFDRFLMFLMAIFGGCMGSVTGGIKIVRLLVLLKITATELTKTMHPRMLTVIRVNKITVPPKIVGRILGFFFLACLTLFICAAVLSFMGPKFSEAVAMAAACLTNVGTFPGICDAANFLALPEIGKIFCMIILILGRLEIFALLIAVAGLATRRNFKEW